MSVPATQNALILDKKFGNLTVSEIQVYKPGPGEILIKIHATSLNPVDWKLHKYGLVIEEFPAILGSDIAGDVAAVGEGVTEWKVGDKVFCHGRYENSWSSFQQYTLSLASTAARIPDNLNYDQVAVLPVAVTTTYIGMYNANPYGIGLSPPISEETRGMYAGNPFLVMGGSSSVGQMVLQFARLSGFSPIITTAAGKHSKLLESLGATHVLDRSLPIDDLVEEIKKILTGKPLKHAYDCISSAATQSVAINALSPGGQVAMVNYPEVPESDDKKIVFVLGLLQAPHNIKLLETLYHDKITEMLEKGLIKANHVEVLPNGLAGIPDGLLRMQENKVSALKLVAHPQETS